MFIFNFTFLIILTIWTLSIKFENVSIQRYPYEYGFPLTQQSTPIKYTLFLNAAMGLNYSERSEAFRPSVARVYGQLGNRSVQKKHIQPPTTNQPPTKDTRFTFVFPPKF